MEFHYLFASALALRVSQAFFRIKERSSGVFIEAASFNDTDRFSLEAKAERTFRLCATAFSSSVRSECVLSHFSCAIAFSSSVFACFVALIFLLIFKRSSSVLFSQIAKTSCLLLSAYFSFSSSVCVAHAAFVFHL